MSGLSEYVLDLELGEGKLIAESEGITTFGFKLRLSQKDHQVSFMIGLGSDWTAIILQYRLTFHRLPFKENIGGSKSAMAPFSRLSKVSVRLSTWVCM